ncbi:MAG: sugar ABC transporter permease [candidate division Zixibacteria bacterium]|nr:sugar ABC transporter permease [candidate division Zixibacteria bacterium]
MPKPKNTILFLLPWIIILLLFWLFPLVYSFILSFTKYSVLSGKAEWVGLLNYLKLLKDPDFWTALKNTSFFVFGTIPFTTAFALILAILVNQKIPWRGFMRAGFFIPSITSLVVISLVFIHLYARDGYFNFLLNLLNLPSPEKGFLFSEKTALLSIMFMDVWIATGYYMLLFLAALQAIPVELYEISDTFGANFFQKFRFVTLPHLRPMFLFVILINTIKSFQIFIEVFVMTKGGPLNSTLTMVYLVYDEGLYKFNFGYASAVAYVLFFIIMIFSLLQMKTFGLGRGIED